MTLDELKNYLVHTIIFTEADAMKVVGLMGAVFKRSASASKQGGGDTLHSPQWPDRTIIQTSEMVTIEGTLRMFNEWNAYASFGMHPHPSGPKFFATVEGVSVAGRDACAALWAGALASGIKPHAYLGFRAVKSLSPGMRGDAGLDDIIGASATEPAGDRPVDHQTNPPGSGQPEQMPAGQDGDQRTVAVGDDVQGVGVSGVEVPRIDPNLRVE